MSEDWPRLAKALEDALNKPGMTRARIQAAGGPSSEVIRQIINGTKTSLEPEKAAGIEKAVGWRAGSWDDTLAGGSPTMADSEGMDDAIQDILSNIETYGEVFIESDLPAPIRDRVTKEIYELAGYVKGRSSGVRSIDDATQLTAEITGKLAELVVLAQQGAGGKHPFGVATKERTLADTHTTARAAKTENVLQNPPL